MPPHRANAASSVTRGGWYAAQRAIAAGIELPNEVADRYLEEMAELLCARVSYFEHVRFTNTGSEAVMMAIKAARAMTGRPKVFRWREWSSTSPSSPRR